MIYDTDIRRIVEKALGLRFTTLIVDGSLCLAHQHGDLDR